MRSSLLSAVVCACITFSAASSGFTADAGADEASGSYAQNSPVGAWLVIPAEESLVGGQGAAAEEARRSNPEAVAARVASESAYEGMNTEAAQRLAGEAFPTLIGESNGGSPRLPAGQRITSFINPYAAEVSLSDGERGLVESTVPMAMETAPRSWSPVGLGLRRVGGGFEPANPLVAVQAPKLLSEGMRLSGLGLSVTPVDGQGSALGGSKGVVDGATEFFANTQTDADTVFKPSALGFAVDTVLRSARSPEQLSFQVGLPVGASLAVAADGSGLVRVIKDGVAIAVVPTPTAHDASGNVMPVSVSVSGDTLTLTVAHRSGSVTYPVDVDPEFNVASETISSSAWRNWHFGQVSSGGFTEEAEQSNLAMSHTGSFPQGNWADFATETKGDSKIYKFSVKDGLWTKYTNSGGEGTYPYLDAWLEIFKPGVESHTTTLSGYPVVTAGTVCANTGCSPEGGVETNLARFEETTLESSVGLEKAGHPEDLPYGGRLSEATTYISQPKETHSTVSYSKNAEIEYTAEGKPVKAPNVLYNGSWLGANQGAFEIKSEDLGLGVAEGNLELYKAGKWETIFLKNYLTEGGCNGVQCERTQHEPLVYSTFGPTYFHKYNLLPDGEDKIRIAAHDPMEKTSSTEHGEGETILKVDGTPPHGIVFSGLNKTGEEYELGEITANLKAEATDGEGSVPSSGIKSLVVGIDGREFGKPSGYCAPGPCTASGEWAINGAELGAGTHTLSIVATDNAGNVETKNVILNVYHASPVAMGPGSVNPESGDFALEANDVDLSGGMGPLTVSRHYDSRNTNEGAEGPLGPQWTISLGSLASLEVLPDESVMIVGPDGLTHFTKKEGKFEAPDGDSSLTLEYKTGEYLLSNKAKGTTTRFTLPSGATLWMPTASSGPVATDTTTAEYEAVEPEAGKKVVEPTLELAPHPSATCIHTKHETRWEAGCRGLTFVYATATTATGENQTEWGEYKGRLKEVIALLYNPATKKLQEPEPVVARYEYDVHGRLRVEWDPRITPGLKTTYGYDPEGHVTALTSPGQQPWTFTYGSISNDASLGRLLKATQAQPATGATKEQIETTLKEQAIQAKNTEAPKITGVPVVGIRLAVSNGKWTGSPVSYGYQWEDCNGEGKECTPIPGATNANYTPTSTDISHTLVALVSTTNGGGTVVATSAASGKVQGGEITEYSPPHAGDPGSITAGPDGNQWFTEYTANKVVKITTSGIATEYSVTSNGNPSGIATGSDGNLWFSLESISAIGKITTSGTITEYTLPIGSQPSSITAGPDSNLWFTEFGKSKIGKITTSGTITEYSLPEGSFPMGITAGPDKNLWFTDWNTNKIGKITTSGTITEYSLPSGSGPQSITPGPDGNLWFADVKTNKIGKITTSGTVTEYSLPSGSGPSGVAPGSDGNVWFSESSTSKIGKITPSGAITEYSLPEKSQPADVAAGTDKNVWFVNYLSDKVGKINPNPTEGEHQTPGPGSTVAYNVPLSGTGLQNMTPGEVEKWGQKDDPVYATAIFPPDEPQGWPASSYTHATISYLDSQARTVNVASPGGAITTTEYNENNDVERTLSAANRGIALKESCESKEKCKSAEAAATLDTENKYAGEGSELTETTGPQHKIRLASGSEVEARSHIKYSYDEGAPEGEEYGLVTKTVASSLVAGKEEEPRTTRTYYSGQKGLGWKLRQPTSTVTDPAGLDLTHTTVYNETTGNVVETKAPGGTSEAVYPPVYGGKFGSAGSGSGQFNDPQQPAIDGSETVWVTDTANSRIEKFSSTGTYLASYGSVGSGNEQFQKPTGIAIEAKTGDVYVSDTGNKRIMELDSSGKYLKKIGTEGEGTLKEPAGIYVDATGNLWVADRASDQIVEFSSTGAFIRKFGSYGTGNGELKEPTTLTIAEGSLYVVDSGNNRIEQFTITGIYLNQFGTTGSKLGQFNRPYGIAVNQSSGDLFITDQGNNRIQEFSPAGKPLCAWEDWTETHEFYSVAGIAINANGKLYIANNENNGVSEWSPPETGGAHLIYNTQFGSKGSGEGQLSGPAFSAIDGSGNVWVTDYFNNRVEEFSSKGKYVASYGKEGTGEDQFKHPVGIDVNQSTGNVYIADNGNNRIEELSSTGGYIRWFGTSGSGELNYPEGLTIDSSGDIWVADTHHNRIVEFSATGTFIAAYGKEGAGNEQFKSPTDISFSGANLYVTDRGNHRVQELTSSGTYIRQFGTEGSGSGELYTPQGIAADSAGNLYVSDEAGNRIEEFSPTGAFRASFGESGSGEGQLSAPYGLILDPAGDMYVMDSKNNRIEQWDNVNQAVHDTKTIYYTAGEEAEASTCRKHPEWVNLACETLPAAQPETPELPNLAVSTIKSYNVWNESETVTETFGTTTRTRTTTFDSAGRALTSEVTAPIDTPVSAVKDKYDEKTGALTEETTTSGGKEVTTKRAINTLGQLEKYTDADGSVTTYKHDIDGRVTEMANVIETGGKKESTYQKYSYDETTDLMTKLEDSGAGTFTAIRDVEGRVISETYPNAMTAYTTYGPAGEATSIRYEKTSHCEKTCPETWFKETVVPASGGEAAQRTNTLASEAYNYDAAGRLVQVQETPAGKGCVTRLYSYDEESNRRSLTSRAPGVEGRCATEGGTTENHTYDAANRLTDPGVSYETLGNITKLPGTDAGGPEMEIKTEYYADGQAASQTQSGKTYKYMMDPAGRVRETKIETEGKTTTTISHYAGPGSTLSWTSEEEGKAWTRNIPGIDGSLTAIQSSSGTVKLQIHDLQGNVVETASDLETETKPLTSYNSTEFGAPLNGTPPKYAWLGVAGVSTEQASGLVTQDGVTYVPQVGRPLQTQGVVLPIPDSAAIAYVSTIEAGINASAAAASAQQVANAEQAKHALEDKCNIETEGCAADPEKGHNDFGCTINASWGVEVEINATFSCRYKPSSVDFKIEVWRVDKGKLIIVYLKASKPYRWLLKGEFSAGPEECTPGDWYRGWVYGSVWAFGVFDWSKSFVLSGNKQCYVQQVGGSYEDPIEGEPSESGAEEGGGDGN